MIPDQHLYEYAVIRAVPKVEREEFLNVGVVLYCRNKRFLQVKYDATLGRLKHIVTADEVAIIESYLRSFERICIGAADGGAIGALPVAERFRWLTATRSTVLQVSKIHPGFCKDPLCELERMYDQMVL